MNLDWGEAEPELSVLKWGDGVADDDDDDDDDDSSSEKSTLGDSGNFDLRPKLSKSRLLSYSARLRGSVRVEYAA